MTLLDFFFRKSVFSILLLLAGTSLGFSATITLRPVADTSLFQDQTNNNLGGELTIPVGATDQLITNTTLLEVNRGLIKFAVAGAVPSNATITSVTLSLTVVQVPGKGPVDSIFGLRRMLRDWGEGNKRGIQFPEGASATAGEANWNVRFYPTLSWSAPGAAAPIDFTNALSTTNFVQRLGTYAFGPTSNLVADVQAWLKNPAADFGWLLRSENETTPLTNRRFASREDTNNAPRLVIEYTLPTSNIKFDRIELSGTKVNLFFGVEANRAYAVEYRKEPASGIWPTLTNVLSPVAVSNYMVSDSFSQARNRFYRIRSP